MGNKPLFRLGRLFITPGAIEALGRNQVMVEDLVRKHQTGEWSEMCEEDQKENALAVELGTLRVFSTYRLPDQTKVYVITESNREASCVLLPSEY